MACNLLSCWVWPRKGHEAPNATPGSSSDSRMGFREPDYLQFAAVNGRRIKRKWHILEERQIDREYDVVLVPSDGGCVSCCKSVESDWSIGWLEPHAPEFQTERETETASLSWSHAMDVVATSRWTAPRSMFWVLLISWMRMRIILMAKSILNSGLQNTSQYETTLQWPAEHLSA
ncbi:unnamed protein product [Musa acuminata var. zebrina]